MKLKKIKINNQLFNLYFKKGVFIPTATSDFLVHDFLKYNKNIKNKKILDLGCGSGIISIALANRLKKNEYYASDLSNNATLCCKKNFLKFKISGEVKNGNMFKPWLNRKFNYIINDISGISSIIAKKSIWFKYIPSSSGIDGTKLTINIIKNSGDYLTKDGKLYLPLISLSNTKKLLNFAKKKFKNIKIISTKNWFLPNDLEKHKKLLFNMKAKNQINFQYKFGKFICFTKILELRKS